MDLTPCHALSTRGVLVKNLTVSFALIVIWLPYSLTVLLTDAAKLMLTLKRPVCSTKAVVEDGCASGLDSE